MQQNNNILLQDIVIRARQSLLNIDNVTILNSKVAVIIPILNSNKYIVMV